MDDAYRDTLRRVEELWPRVHPAPEPPPPGPPPRPGPTPPPPPGPPRPDWGRGEARRLRSLISAQDTAALRYRAMAAGGKGRARGELLRLAAELERFSRRMRSELFMLSGERVPMPAHRPRPVRPQAMLRESLADAADRNKEFLWAAAGTENPRLRELYGDGAALSEREMRVLRGLVF